MAIERKVIFTRPAEIKPAAFAAMVKDVLTYVGQWWVWKFSLLHYLPGAAQRYQMPARKESVNAGWKVQRAAVG